MFLLYPASHYLPVLVLPVCPQVTYYFDPGCADCAEFDLDTVSGEIRATGSYDREEQSQYILDVWAQDGADSSSGGGPNTGG